MSKKSTKRPWRKLVKKLQRKRKRQKLASQRDKELEMAELQKQKDPLYKSWLEQQEEIERQQLLIEENERQEQEELWLRRELLAQKQFKRDEQKRKAEEAKVEAERLKQEEELKAREEAERKKQEKIKLQAEKTAKEFDDVMTSMKNYLEDITIKTPLRLQISVESRPGEKRCEFFDKTNCCRFDPGCAYNHIRPMLAKTIIIKHFFQHPLLEQQQHEEYLVSDSELELSESDLREAYDEFCEDVWPVLEEFGSILNFRTVRNTHAHLRGHVFVEYKEKRSALKAFISLQNRFYASKRLNVEFSNIRQWHKGVCGMRYFKGSSLSRKCLKGDKCNFLHLMKNVNNKYNQPIENPERLLQRTQIVRETPVISWNCEDNLKSNISGSRGWRWSESPEIELKIKTNDETSQTKVDTSKPATYNNEVSRISCGQSPDSGTNSHKHDKSKIKSFAVDKKHHKAKKLKDFKEDKKENSSSRRRKNSRRESDELNSSYRKSLKRSRDNSPIYGKKRKKRNKSPHR